MKTNMPLFFLAAVLSTFALACSSTPNRRSGEGTTDAECSNNKDDDKDGKTDCEDNGCSHVAVCIPTSNCRCNTTASCDAQCTCDPDCQNVAVACSSFTNAANCVAQTGKCGWCKTGGTGSGGRCLNGTATGPRSASQCTTENYCGTAASCSTGTARTDCDTYSSMNTCIQHSGCGWCRSSETCVGGTSSAPSDTDACSANFYCPGSDSNPSSCLACDKSDRCDTGCAQDPQCIAQNDPCTAKSNSCSACLDTEGCGWCLGRAVACMRADPDNDEAEADPQSCFGPTFVSAGESCPAAPTCTATACGTCVGTTGCGWCPTSNSCLQAASEFSSVGGTCDASEGWTTSASECGGTTTSCIDIESESACAANSSCEWYTGEDGQQFCVVKTGSGSACSTHQNCGTCTAASGCGFCFNGEGCREGTIGGPNDEACASSAWAWSQTQCD